MKVRRICCLNNLRMMPPTAGNSYGMKMTSLSLGNIILLKEKGGMRESIPRQVGKKFRVPKEEKGVWSPQEGERGLRLSSRKGQTFFSTLLCPSQYNNQCILLKDLLLLNKTF